MNNKLGVPMKLAALAVILLLAYGCAHSPGGVAPSTTPINGRSYQVLGDVRTTDSYVLLFGFLPIMGSNSTHDAIRDALRAKGADALIDVTVDKYFQWWILFTRSVIQVQGKAIKFN